MVGEIGMHTYSYCYLCSKTIPLSLSPICDSCLNEPMENSMPHNECTICIHRSYTSTLCSECADRFCLNTCGAIFMYEHKEPAVCPKCHKIHAYSYFESTFNVAECSE